MRNMPAKLKDSEKNRSGGKKPPATPALPEQEVFLQVQRTADRLMRELEEVLKAQRLSPTQYNVLRILRGTGPSGMACHEIACRMITRDPDMTRLLDRLEQRELISREREKEDRRVIRTRISPAGIKLLKMLDEPVRSLHRRQLAHLGQKRLRQLGTLLESTWQE
jgi:DNA-binding MarR family transcriptional regulator